MLNAAAVHACGLDEVATRRSTGAGIAHNKFFLLLQRGGEDVQGTLRPVAVWTGSTNITVSGIFGHANVGQAWVREKKTQTHKAHINRGEQNHQSAMIEGETESIVGLGESGTSHQSTTQCVKTRYESVRGPAEAT